MNALAFSKPVHISNSFCGLIYTLSPGMPMSELGLPEIKNFTSQNQIAIRVIADPQLKNMPQELRLRDKSIGLSTGYESMADVGYFNHFPGYFVQNRDGTIKPLRLGYIFKDDLKNYIPVNQIKELCQ